MENENQLSIILTGVKNNVIEHRKLNLTQDLSKEFKNMLNESLPTILKQLENGDKKIIEYEPGYTKEQYEIEYISLEDEDYADIKNHIDVIPNLTNVNNLDMKDQAFIKKISYFIIQLKDREGNIVNLFRKYLHKKELTKNQKLKAIFSNGRYDSFHEPVLLFDEKIDCIEYKGHMYILDTRQFHFIFQFYEKLTEKAQEIITKMTNRIPIYNVEELRHICSGHPVMLAKIHSISRKNYLEEITIGDIQETIQEYNLDVNVTDGKLIFEKEKRWDILKLLDEHYLDSNMTGRQYEANSKRTHGNK